MIKKIKNIVCGFYIRVKNFLYPLENYPDCPDYFKQYRYFAKHPSVKRTKGGFIYKNEFYPDYLFVGGACCAIFNTAKKYCKGKGVDIGAGFWPFPGSVPVDTIRGKGLTTTLDDIEKSSLDYIFSSHCLEHIENWQDALANWVAKLKKGGIIFLYLPHPDCKIWNKDSIFVGDEHKWIPTFELIEKELKNLKLEIVDFDKGPDAMQSFFICGKNK